MGRKSVRQEDLKVTMHVYIDNIGDDGWVKKIDGDTITVRTVRNSIKGLKDEEFNIHELSMYR